MDHLWSPWRYRYLTGEKPPAGHCVFCSMVSADDDEANLIVHRGQHAFIVLNRFPYTSGHVMVIPYDHAADLADIGEPAATEIMSLTRLVTSQIRKTYRPDGVNLGMNLGEAAGAGVAGHLHMHVLPRWHGDANFMTTVAETRILPEELPVTWQRLRAAFAEIK